MSYESPWVSHLLFAKYQSAVSLNEILQVYADASGKCVNKDKNTIVFSSNTPSHVKQAMKIALDINVEAFSERYLGLHMAVGRITSRIFDYISERAQGKIPGWSEKLLASAGYEVLKSVVQAMPSYSMITFLLTKKYVRVLPPQWLNIS